MSKSHDRKAKQKKAELEEEERRRLESEAYSARNARTGMPGVRSVRPTAQSRLEETGQVKRR